MKLNVYNICMANLMKILVFTFISYLFYIFIPISYRNNKTKKIFLLSYIILGLISCILTYYFIALMNNELIRSIIIYFSTIYFISIYATALVSIFKYLLVYILIKTNKHKQANFFSKDGTYLFLLLIYLGINLIIGLLNSNKLDIKTYDITLANNNNNFLRIAFISDLHVGAGMNENNLDTMVELINSQQADYVFIGGDIIDSTTSTNDLKNLENSLKQLEIKSGIYYVYGNHEKEAYYNIEDTLHNSNVTILNNDILKIDENLNLIGRYYDNKIDCIDIIEQNGYGVNDNYLILQHIPRKTSKLKDLNCLILSGHTHGYRINGTSLSPIANDTEYGYFKNNKAQGIVTSGTSGWGFHYSYPSKNEIVIINLTY